MYKLKIFHQSLYHWQDIYRLMLITLVYAVLAWLVLTFSIGKGNVTIFWLPGGFALATLLVKGIRFWPAVFLGALVAGINVGDEFGLSFLIAIGNTLETISCAWLLRKVFNFDKDLTCISDLLKLAFAATLSSSLSSIIGPLALFVHGYITAQTILHSMLHWWGADTIGIILGTPLFLVWRKWPDAWFAHNRMPMTLGFFLIVFFTGQVVFLDWFHDQLNAIAMGYWIFLLVVWAAVSFGKHGALLVIAITTTQALYGAVYGIGHFGNDLALTGLENFWFYLMILTTVGVTLAISIEERFHGEQKLADSENRFRLFLNNSPMIAWMKDSDGRYVYLNQTYENYFGVHLEDWSGKTDFQIWPEHVALQFRQNDLTVLDAFRTFEFEEQTFDVQNQPIDWVTFKFPFQDSLGNKFIGGIGLDITERKKIENKLKLAGRVLNATQEGVMVTDANRNIVEVNEAFTKINGYTRSELLGQNPRILKSNYHDAEFYAGMWQAIKINGFWNGELWNRRKDGEIYPEWITISAILDNNGNVTNYVGISSDITVFKQHEKQLEHIAHYDALTGIPNRVLLFDRIQQALSQTRREQKLLAICYLDLDGFKPINDNFGHEAGDSVLIEIAQRITHSLRGGDTLARIGGDEFALLLLGLENESECQVSLDRLLNVIAKPIVLDGQLHSVTASIGLTLYPMDDDSPDTLLRHADQAMYLAKQLGKNRYHVFDSEQEILLKARNELRARIEQGLLNQEFELFYQPQVALISYKVIGVEALIRWRHPEQGILSPDQFLPHIDNSYLEEIFGAWVIDTALTQMDDWSKLALNLKIGINVSATFLQTKGFVSMLKQKLLKYPAVYAQQLQIEILETAALADISAVTRLIEECAALGVSFALDDFGTGYSSLSYLRRLPADTLKIDLSFVRDMLIDKEDRAIVKGVIALAHTFNRSTVAEGVESQEHFDALRDMGCDIAQGYGIARPMPADQIVSWYQEYAENTHGEHDHKLNLNVVPTDVHWDCKFEIGHERIDSEHKIFLGLIMEVSKEINGRCNYQRIQRLLYEVRKYAEFHFVSEENIMEEINYPALEAHRSLHKRLLASLADSAFENNREQESYIPLLNFLIEWFIMHTATEDKKVSLFIEAEQSIKNS